MAFAWLLSSLRFAILPANSTPNETSPLAKTANPSPDFQREPRAGPAWLQELPSTRLWRDRTERLQQCSCRYSDGRLTRAMEHLLRAERGSSRRRPQEPQLQTYP